MSNLVDALVDVLAVAEAKFGYPFHVATEASDGQRVDMVFPCSGWRSALYRRRCARALS